jgi:type IV pilus assembly protein PilM
VPISVKSVYIPDMFNPLNLLKQQVSPTYLGVDIGTTSIKMIEVDKGKNGPRLLRYGMLESQSSLSRANTAIQTSTLKLFDDDVVNLLKLLITKVKPQSDQVLASLPPFAAFMTVLSFPQMGQADLEKALSFEARQYIPLPISEVALDWLKVGEYQDESGFKYDQILLISVPQEQIKKYQRIFKLAGLRLMALEIENLSLVRATAGADPTTTILVDIGSRSTTIIVSQNGELKFNGQTDYGGAFLTQALANSLGINTARAEELKKERGILGTGPEHELSTIMLPFLDVIISEVKRVNFNYISQFPKAPKVERVLLMGGGANLLGIEKYFERQLEMPVVKASPLSKFEYPPLMEPLAGELNPLLSVSLGLALKQFI